MLEAAWTGAYTALMVMCVIGLLWILIWYVVRQTKNKLDAWLVIGIPVIIIVLGTLAGIASYLTH